ncbi:MAG: diversity-generating retroelement protein Avd [Culicoidibacterales bacterium]
MQELQIIQETYDMLNYAHLALNHYPKSEKFVLTAKTRETILDFLQLLVRAKKKFHKKTTLQDADVLLEQLRYLFRLALDLRYLPFKKYENLSKMLSSIGNQLGGWIKSMK